MKRKLVQHGQTSIIVSLPIDWVRENNLKPGNIVEIQKTSDALLITKEKEQITKQYTIKADIIDRSTLYLLLLNLYRKGYQEINISFKEKKIIDYEREKKEDIAVKVNHWLPRFLGWEIISQDKNSIIIKDVAATVREDPDILLKRISFLLRSFAESKEISINTFYETVVKLINLTIRAINQQHQNQEKILFLQLLHQIAQQLKSLGKEMQKNKEIFKPIFEQLIYLTKLAAEEQQDLSLFSKKRLILKKLLEKQKLEPVLHYQLLYLQKLIKEAAYALSYMRIH